MSEPAYTRLQVDERREQLIEAGARLFAEHAYEEISMREVAQAAGVSKALLYHYFPSKIELFKAAVAEKAAELGRLIEPSGDGSPLEQLNAGLDADLAWIEDNSQTWSKLMQSAATLPEAREIVEGFRQHTMDLVLAELAGEAQAAPGPAHRRQGLARLHGRGDPRLDAGRRSPARPAAPAARGGVRRCADGGPAGRPEDRAAARWLSVTEAFAGVVEFPAGTLDRRRCRGRDWLSRRADREVARVHPGLLVLCSGSNTVDTDRLGLVKADADFVRQATGFAIGGVPPWGWTTPPARTVIDPDLLGYEQIWAAAGTPRSVFPLSPSDLVARTG